MELTVEKALKFIADFINTYLASIGLYESLELKKAYLLVLDFFKRVEKEFSTEEMLAVEGAKEALDVYINKMKDEFINEKKTPSAVVRVLLVSFATLFTTHKLEEIDFKSVLVYIALFNELLKQAVKEFGFKTVNSYYKYIKNTEEQVLLEELKRVLTRLKEKKLSARDEFAVSTILDKVEEKLRKIK